MSRWEGRYLCLSCVHEWTAPAGPVTCPRCDGLMVKWLNYDALLKQNGPCDPAERRQVTERGALA
mgnify:CR=1 FL=1